MDTSGIRTLINRLTQGDPDERAAARVILCSLEEAAVEPLIDTFYAGTTEQTAVAILQTLALIGGPDALATLRSVFTYEEERPAVRDAAALGLMENHHTLSDHEITELVQYLGDRSGGA